VATKEGRGTVPDQAYAASRRAAERLRKLCEAREESLRSIERALGWSQGYLSQLFDGRVPLRLSHVYAILEAAKIDPAAFFAGLHPAPLPELAGEPEHPLFRKHLAAAQTAAMEYLVDRLRERAILADAEAEELLRLLAHLDPTPAGR
jgi:transcriptional regulator with XRE-family HTH domain